MKRKIVKIIALTIMIFSTSTATATLVNSVDVIPPQPLDTDRILLYIFGSTGFSPCLVEYDEFYQNGTSLQLDLYCEVGLLALFTDWEHWKVIQPLPPETYTLQVRTFEHDTLRDTYTVDFTVVPEPATVLLLAFGGLLLTRRRR